MNAMHLQAMDIIPNIPDAMIGGVVEYLSNLQVVAEKPTHTNTLDFSKYTRKGKIPLGMDAQEWVAGLRSNDRI